MTGVTLSPVFGFLVHLPITRTRFWGLEKKFKKTKSSQIFIVTHRDRGGFGTHYPGKWFVSVRVRTEERVQSLLHFYQELVDNTM